MVVPLGTPERQGQLGASLDEHTDGHSTVGADGPIEMGIAGDGRERELEAAIRHADVRERKALHALSRNCDGALPAALLGQKIHKQVQLPAGQFQRAFPMTGLQLGRKGLCVRGDDEHGSQKKSECGRFIGAPVDGWDSDPDDCESSRHRRWR